MDHLERSQPCCHSRRGMMACLAYLFALMLEIGIQLQWLPSSIVHHSMIMALIVGGCFCFASFYEENCKKFFIIVSTCLSIFIVLPLLYQLIARYF